MRDVKISLLNRGGQLKMVGRMVWKLFFSFIRLCLKFRYRIEVRGLEEMKAKVPPGKKGILFLPNHPAHIDPVILFALLWNEYRMRPLVVEFMYRMPMLRPIMKAVKALPIPNFDTSVNQLKVKKAERSIQAIADGLKDKESFVLYPAGRLKSTAKEVIGGASSTHALIQECPDIDVVLVRMSGLWGSQFSRAILGRSPGMVDNAIRSFKNLVRNLFFFIPRRKVVIEFEANPKDFPWKGTRVELNRYLEQWYDQYLDPKGVRHANEPLYLVSYAFWRKDVPIPFQQKKKEGGEQNGIEISPKTRDKVYGEIRRIMNNPDLPIDDEKDLAFDLGMDSLNIGEMIAFLTHEFDVGEAHPEDITTVRSALELAEGARVSEEPVHTTLRPHWPDEKNRPGAVLPLGKTLPAAFLNSCDRLGSFAACGDDLVGVLSYRKMKRAALVLAQYFKTIEDQYVAVMLPASAGAFVTILALQLAGKVPVMLNWTLGPRYLEEMMKTSGAKIALSSWRFLERLSHVDFGGLVDQFVLLEDVRENLTLRQKLGGALLALRGANAILEKMGLNDIDEESHAVVLFTSGTEAVPKGVPLSHKNILSNLRGGMQCIELRDNDVMYGVLPPFHSFGFTVAGIFSLLCGLRIAFYPDPTDSFALAEGMERWKVTIFCSAPSFLKGLLSAAKPEQLTTIRYLVSGAERLPPEIREKAKAIAPHSLVIEGYGITECSPILTISRPNLPPKGVGRPLPEVEVCMIHPESLELLPMGSEGEICVRGPNVFHGYLGKPRDPFIELQGKKWYRTGDLGRIDPDGSLILSGRLKRFTKVGGEMISLGAVEEVIATELIRRGAISSDLPGLAVCSDERIPSKPQLILFTTADLNPNEANEILKTAGFSRLVKIASVQKIEEIPLMGTGKTDYRRLQSNIA